MLNKAVYEALPLAYIGSGVAIGTLLDSPVKFLPAMLFVGAGSLVLNWRWHARSKTAQAQRRRLDSARHGRGTKAGSRQKR
jgi:hypothetical protein